MKNVLVISSYPEQDTTHSEKTVGVASYTKTLLGQLLKATTDLKLTVFSEIDSKTQSYREGGILVERIWQRGNLLSLLQMFFKTYQHEAKTILIPFEAYMFGKPVHTATAIIALALLKLSGKNIFIMMHQVIDDFRPLEKNAIKAYVLNIAKSLLYKMILFATHTVIVFEEQLKIQLDKNSPHIVVIPHFVPENLLANGDAPKALAALPDETYTVLYFGFIAPYKGIDLLVDNWPDIPNTKLIVTGGMNPNYATNPSYQQFVQQVLHSAKKKNIMTTGFVKEEDMAAYFNRADVVILPYKNFMSSSGPLSFAFSFHKPVLLSESLRGYGQSKDFKEALTQAGLTMNELTFSPTKDDLARAMLESKKHQEKLAVFARLMQEKRAKKTIAAMLYKTLFAHA